MRLKFTETLEGKTSRFQSRWQRQSERATAAEGASGSVSMSTASERKTDSLLSIADSPPSL